MFNPETYDDVKASSLLRNTSIDGGNGVTWSVALFTVEQYLSAGCNCCNAGKCGGSSTPKVYYLSVQINCITPGCSPGQDYSNICKPCGNIYIRS